MSIQDLLPLVDLLDIKTVVGQHRNELVNGEPVVNIKTNDQALPFLPLLLAISPNLSIV